MKLLRRLVTVLLALLTLAVVATYLVPLDTYVPKIEQTLSARLHEPVSIQQIGINILPLPSLELQGVRLGDKDGVAVRSVSVEPDWLGLLEWEVAIGRILVQDGTVDFAQVRKLIALFSNLPAAAQGVAVHEVQFFGMNLLVPGMTLGGIEGKLDFTDAGDIKHIWIAADGQKVTAVLLPLPDQLFSVKAWAHDWVLPQYPQFPLDDVQVEGVLGKQDFAARKFSVASRSIHLAGSGKVEFPEGWRVQVELAQAEALLEQLMTMLGKPVELSGALSVKGTLSSKASTLDKLKDNFRFSGEVLVNHATAHIATGLQHPLMFEQVRARVTAQPELLEMNALEARLYGGKLTGTASVNRKALLVADVAASGIAMKSLVEALTNEVLFTGSMDGRAKFSMRLDMFERFPENMQLTGDFRLRNGVLTKVDLEQATQGSKKGKGAGGTTKFNELTSLLTVDASGYHFSKLIITSDSLKAEGKLDVSPSLQLKGTLDTNVKGTGGLISMPVVIYGTASKPVVGPSGSVVAGAAVGTAILGPGLGTAIGIKIGGFLNKLFGKNDDKNKESVPEPPANE